jgi:hypothetical protein
MTSGPGPVTAWSAEYRVGRYRDEPSVAVTQEIFAAARGSGVARGLYIGCGNGRNYLTADKRARRGGFDHRIFLESRASSPQALSFSSAPEITRGCRTRQGA